MVSGQRSNWPAPLLQSLINSLLWRTCQVDFTPTLLDGGQGTGLDNGCIRMQCRWPVMHELWLCHCLNQPAE
jgi:hypothetical protein